MSGEWCVSVIQNVLCILGCCILAAVHQKTAAVTESVKAQDWLVLLPVAVNQSITILFQGGTKDF